MIKVAERTRKVAVPKKDGFGRCPPVPKFLPNVSPCKATLAEESTFFDIPGPKQPERGHIRQNRTWVFKGGFLQVGGNLNNWGRVDTGCNN